MKKQLFIMPLLLLLGSCVIDDYGEAKVSPLFWIILGSLLVTTVIMIISSEKTRKNTEERLSKRNEKLSDYKVIGKYVGGHPDLDKEINFVSVKKGEGELLFFEQESSYHMPKHRFSISADKVKSIEIEDASTIERRITAGRLLLVGVFAFAWKKKKKTEVAFITINWNDGRFDHSTTFVNEGSSSFNVANKARNLLINLCK